MVMDRAQWITVAVAAVREGLKGAHDISRVATERTEADITVTAYDAQGEIVASMVVHHGGNLGKRRARKPALALGAPMSAPQLAASSTPAAQTSPPEGLTFAAIGLCEVRVPGETMPTTLGLAWQRHPDGGWVCLATQAHREALLSAHADAVLRSVSMAPNTDVTLALIGQREVVSDLAMSCCRTSFQGEATFTARGAQTEVTLPPSGEEAALAEAIHYAVASRVPFSLTVRPRGRKRGGA